MSHTEQMREALRKIKHEAVSLADAQVIALDALTAPAAEVPEAMGDAEIEATITKAVREGRLSWLGFKKDDQGAYTIPVLSPSDYQAARAIIAARDAQWQSTRLRGGVPEIDYTPGNWYEAKDRDDLQAFFLSRLPAIREAAREHGYAIGLHGSLRRDMDLIAVPWREGASDKDVLAHAIAMAACGITRDGPYQWEQKPLGRVAASLSCCWPRWFNEAGAGHIDLSVMGPLTAAPQAPAAALDAGVVRDGWSVSAYKVGTLTVQSMSQLDGRTLWKIADGFGNVLNKQGEWEWEPMPSSRDDEFLARCRYATLDDVLAAMSAQAGGGK